MTRQKLLKKQADKTRLLLRLVCLALLFCLAHPIPGAWAYSLSFFQSVGHTDWELGVNDFSVSATADDNVFRLRIQQPNHLKFSIHPVSDPDTVLSGPLHHRYSEMFSRLLDHALRFIEKKKNVAFSMGMAFENDPERIQKWAAVWQASPLNEKWDQMDPHLRYAQLTSMMSDFFQTEMNLFAQKSGFEAMGASMEKMTYPVAGQLEDYKRLLMPAGILPDTIIPIPLMVYIRLGPLQGTSLPQADPNFSYSIDTLFAAAKKERISIYVSFNRALNEYGIAGDSIHADGTVDSILPMNRDTCIPIASRMLNACLMATKGNENPLFSLRIHLEAYPELNEKITQSIHSLPKDSRLIIFRPELGHIPFYRYLLDPDSGISPLFNPFLTQIGYELKEFHIGLSNSGIVYLIASKTR